MAPPLTSKRNLIPNRAKSLIKWAISGLKIPPHPIGTQLRRKLICDVKERNNIPKAFDTESPTSIVSLIYFWGEETEGIEINTRFIKKPDKRQPNGSSAEYCDTKFDSDSSDSTISSHWKVFFFTTVPPIQIMTRYKGRREVMQNYRPNLCFSLNDLRSFGLEREKENYLLMAKPLSIQLYVCVCNTYIHLKLLHILILTLIKKYHTHLKYHTHHEIFHKSFWNCLRLYKLSPIVYLWHG